VRPEVQAQLKPFFVALSHSTDSALLLDYDGTLAPFQAQRNRAFPYPGVALLLQEIVREAYSRVVVISGREVTDLLPLIDIHPRPEIWGIHGLQRLRTDGTTEMPHLDDRTLQGLSDAERWLSYKHLRHRAEFKPGGIAVHWRGLPALDAADLRARVLLGWRPIVEEHGLDLLDFDGGIEIRARKANKGDAVRDFLEEVSPETPVAYLGDDTTDEQAFHAMRGRGVTILMRPEWRESAAQFWLSPPGELIEFLQIWLKTSAAAQRQGYGGGAKVANL